MDKLKLRSELNSLSQVILVITVTIFSVVLIIMNRLMSWEAWILPLFIIGTIMCWILHVGRQVSERMRVYTYALILIFELFYYTVNVESIFDSSALLVVSLVLLAMTEESLLVNLAVIMGYAGMLLNLYLRGSFAIMGNDSAFSLRVTFAFVIIMVAAFMVEKVIKAWMASEKLYLDRIAEVEKENETANNFLANVSHEIRTPINAVMGLSTVLEAESLPPRIMDSIDAISAAGHMVADQISDILDFTEIDMKRLAINNETYMVSSLINDILNQLSFSERSELELVINMDPDLPAELTGDPLKLKKILWHLISNGMKFTNDGGVYAHIYSIKRDYGINLVFEITDTGVGMSESEIDKIYMKFYQADSGRARAVGGLGLGIPIVNGFTEAMGGFMSIHSIENEGTIVRVSIPQKVNSTGQAISVMDKDKLCTAAFISYEMVPHPKIREFYDEMMYDFVSRLGLNFHRITTVDDLRKMVSSYRLTHLFVGLGEYLNNKDYIDSLAEDMIVSVIAHEEDKKKFGKGVTLLPKPLYGGSIANVLNAYFEEGKALNNLGRLMFPDLRVLVVDDEPMNLMVAKGIFESYGMEVTTAMSGFEAIEKCELYDYDVVFMDHMMPKMDGIEAMKRIRLSLSKLKKETNIIALTANAISTAKDMFMSEGFDGFVPKPIEVADLERVLKHVLPRSAYAYESELKDTLLYKDLELRNYQSMDDAYSEADAEISAVNEEGPYKSLVALGVNTSMGLKYCKSDGEFYNELLMEYARDRKGKAESLNSYFEEKDWGEYAIRIHAVKSTSKMIGAMGLYEIARSLEDAAKKADEDTIAANHPGFMPMYVKLMDTINELFNGSEEAGDEGDDEALEFEPVGAIDDEILEFEAKEI